MAKVKKECPDRNCVDGQVNLGAGNKAPHKPCKGTGYVEVEQQAPSQAERSRRWGSW